MSRACSQDASYAGEHAHVGEVIKLDRGFPLVKLEDGRVLRCEHATAYEKFSDERAVIGDIVDVEVLDGHDKAVIVDIHSRQCTFTRKDPTERTVAQVLAANFDRVIIIQAINEVNSRRLERELVLAHETGANVAIVLTKADLVQNADQIEATLDQVRTLAGPDVDTLVASNDDATSIEKVRNLVGTGTSILIGRSGVGKSTLINGLLGTDMLPTTEVREKDGKGRHTTVSREIIELPGGGRVVDMPGVRGLGLWDADEGIEAAFPDIESMAEKCRFRDCTHGHEPGCAVRAAVESGEIAKERYESYQTLRQETSAVKQRREHARWMTSEQTPESKRATRRCAGVTRRRKRHPS